MEFLICTAIKTEKQNEIIIIIIQFNSILYFNVLTQQLQEPYDEDNNNNNNNTSNYIKYIQP
jgi:hypothetical protein